MAAGDKRVLRWLVTVGASANVIRIRKAGYGAISDQTITAGTYINRGSAGSPTDLIATLETAIQAAVTALWGAGIVISVDLTTSGKVRISQDVAGAGSVEIDWAGSTLPPSTFGFVGGTDAIPTAPLYLESEGQVSGCWYPATWHLDDRGEVRCDDVAMVRGPTKRPAYLVHSDISAPSWVRRVTWDDIASARISTWWAADATAAAVAGITAGDSNVPLEAMWKYVIQNGQVYLYSTEDPATHVQAGPYYVTFGGDWMEAGGVPDGSIREDLTQRQFRVELELSR